VAKKDSSLIGYSDPISGDIYIIKDAPQGVVEHERFHSIKRHPESPRTYRTFLDHELEAYEYAWKKSKSPSHIKAKFRGMFNSCASYIKNGQATPRQVIQYMKKKLFSLDVPDAWKQDYNEVLVEFNKAYRG
jgi:hypothetical protein